jgi:acyl-CoA thioester hydrolase
MNDIKPYFPEIRFSDVDAYGIVHNAKYLVYMEQARIHWWSQAMEGGSWDWTKIGVLVAHHTIDYLSPVHLGDMLEVSCVAGNVGTKSMDVHYTMSCQGRPVAKAKTVLVCFDHRQKRTTSVPQEWREVLERRKAPAKG